MPEASTCGVVGGRRAQALAQGRRRARAAVDDNDDEPVRLSRDGEDTSADMTNSVARELGGRRGDLGGDAGRKAAHDRDGAHEDRSHGDVGDGVEFERDRLLSVEARSNLRVERVMRWRAGRNVHAL